MARTKVKVADKKEKKTAKVSKVAKVIKDTVEALTKPKKTPAKIVRMMEEIDRIQAEEEKLSDRKEALKNEVKAYMKENGLEKVLTENLKALYSVSYRTSFDEKGFSEKHPKMYKVYLTFKVKGDKPIESLKVSNITETKRKK